MSAPVVRHAAQKSFAPALLAFLGVSGVAVGFSMRTTLRGVEGARTRWATMKNEAWQPHRSA